MKIRLTALRDLPGITRLDNHIPAARLAECVRSHQVYILLDSSHIAGVLRYSLFWQSIPFLDLLFLEESYRSKGHGSRMMRHWESTMAALGYSHVMLSTQADETAKFFYEKIGYHRIGAFLPPEQEANEIMYAKTI